MPIGPSKYFIGMGAFSEKGFSDGFRGYALEQQEANKRLKDVIGRGIVISRPRKTIKRQNAYQRSQERKRENRVFDSATDYIKLRKTEEYKYLKKAGVEDLAKYFGCDPNEK